MAQKIETIRKISSTPRVSGSESHKPANICQLVEAIHEGMSSRKLRFQGLRKRWRKRVVTSVETQKENNGIQVSIEECSTVLNNTEEM